MVKIIAEIGWNHMGDMELAKRMAYEAKDNGADIVKTQTFNVSKLKAGPWDTDGRREIYEKAQLSLEQHIELRDYCRDIEVTFSISVDGTPPAQQQFYRMCRTEQGWRSIQ